MFCFASSDGDVVPGVQDGAAGLGQSDENEEVMRALLIHEKRAVAGAGAASAATRGLASTTANASDSDSDTSESDDDAPSNPLPAAAAHQRVNDEEDEDDDFEEVGDEPMVMVGGRLCSYQEVSQRPELVEQMSAQEKEAYIEMGQNLFQDMYY